MLTLTELKNVLNLAALKHFDIGDFQDHLFRFNVDRTAVNVGLNGGVGTLLKEKSSWLHVTHCFSHRLELALRDAFKNEAFVKIDGMLSVLYKLYQ